VIPVNTIKEVIDEAIIKEQILHISVEKKDQGFELNMLPQLDA